MKFYHFYYLLASFDILILGCSLLINHRSVEIYKETTSSSHHFVSIASELDKLTDFIAQANAPGNDIFESHDPKLERKRVDEILSHYNFQFDKLAQFVKLGTGNESNIYLTKLNEIDQKFKEMCDIAYKIFYEHEQGKIKKAGSYMAMMDQTYAIVHQKISSFRSQLIQREATFLAAQSGQIFNMSFYEKILALSILLIVGAVATIGHYIGKRIEQKDKLLLQSSKMSALGEMAGGIAHEINNPLATIRLKTSQLRRLVQAGKQTPDQSATMLQQIEETTIRVSQIIDGLKNFSRNNKDEKSSNIQVSKVFKDITGLCSERFAREGVKLIFENPKDIEIHCRIIQIEQVLLNLVNNSFDAVKKTPNAWVCIKSCLNEEDQLEVSVTDSGNGISSDIATKMMQPFFTTKPIGEGTGLGLSISLGIIEAHGGTLSYNPESKNTQFIIKIPNAQYYNPQLSTSVA